MDWLAQLNLGARILAAALTAPRNVIVAAQYVQI